MKLLLAPNLSWVNLVNYFILFNAIPMQNQTMTTWATGECTFNILLLSFPLLNPYSPSRVSCDITFTPSSPTVKYCVLLLWTFAQCILKKSDITVSTKIFYLASLIRLHLCVFIVVISSLGPQLLNPFRTEKVTCCKHDHSEIFFLNKLLTTVSHLYPSWLCSDIFLIHTFIFIIPHIYWNYIYIHKCAIWLFFKNILHLRKLAWKFPDIFVYFSWYKPFYPTSYRCNYIY